MIARSTVEMWGFRLTAEALCGDYLGAGHLREGDLVSPHNPDVITLREEDGVWLSQTDAPQRLSVDKVGRRLFSPALYDGAGRPRLPGEAKGLAIDLFA